MLLILGYQEKTFWKSFGPDSERWSGTRRSPLPWGSAGVIFGTWAKLKRNNLEHIQQNFKSVLSEAVIAREWFHMK